MPRPRYFKLSEARRQVVLDTAAAEFAAHGYHGASINRIQTQLKVSKGAFYYWFNDKEDLFLETLSSRLTTIRTAVGGMLSDDPVQPGPFWPQLEATLRAAFTHVLSHPSDLALLKATLALPPDSSARVMHLWQQGLRHVTRVITIGQQRELVRTDLPVDLLANMTFAIGEALDRHLLTRTDADNIDIDAWVAVYLGLMQRLLS